MIAELYGPSLRRPPFLGVTLDPSCDPGPRPVRSDYPEDPEGYQSDYTDWRTQYNACLAQTNAEAAGTAAAPAAAPAPAEDPNSDDAIAAGSLAWMATIGIGPGNSLYEAWKAEIKNCLAAGILNPDGDYGNQTGKCAGASPTPSISDVALAGQALGVAGTAASTGALIASATSVIPIIGAAVGVGTLFIFLLSKLFGPPVSELEQKTLCTAVAAANAVLKQITAELKAGYISAAQANSAMNQLVSSFNGAVASILQIQTPNDTQWMESALGAIAVKNANVVYPQLEAQANQAKANVQAQQQAALQQQINTDVQTAVAKAATPAPAPAATPVTAPAPASVAAGPAVTVPPTPIPSASWFSETEQIGPYKIPNWALLLGAGILLAVGA